jgi:beta-ureidopropionase / N-carbamoyl-L-amino-acid hydrolase
MVAAPFAWSIRMKAADRPNLRVDFDRLWSSLMELGQIGGTEKGGVCRIALTDLDRQGRDLFVTWAKEAGCTIKVDQLGNIFARREGRDPTKPPVMTGSHLDTQPTGGKFDGAYGVMAGLEVLRVLHDSNYVTEAPIEVAVWTSAAARSARSSRRISSRGRSSNVRRRRSAW